MNKKIGQGDLVNKRKGKIGLMTASLLMLCYLAPTSILASLSEAFPDTSLQTIQMLTAVPNVFSVATSILISRVTPYVYKRHLILLAGISYPVAGLLIFFIHPNICVMIAFMCLMGIGSGVHVTCVPSLICDCYDEKESGTLMGLQAGFISAGAMFFSWLGGQLAKDHWEYCFLGYSFIIVFLLIEWCCLPKGKLDQKAAAQPGSAAGEALKTESGDRSDPENTGKAGLIPRAILYYTIIAFIYGIFSYVFHSNISLLVTLREFGSTVASSYVSILYNLAGLIMGCIAGILIRKVKEFSFALSFLIAAAGLFTCFFAGQYAVVCLGGILCGAGFNIMAPAGNFFAAQAAAGKSNQSFCIAFFNCGCSLGQFISPVVFGTLLPMVATESRFLVGAAALLVLTGAASCGAGVMRKRRFAGENH